MNESQTIGGTKLFNGLLKTNTGQLSDNSKRKVNDMKFEKLGIWKLKIVTEKATNYTYNIDILGNVQHDSLDEKEKEKLVIQEGTTVWSEK